MTAKFSSARQEVFVGVELTVQCIFNPITNGVGHTFAATDLPRGNNCRYLLSKRLGWARSRLGVLETTNRLPLSGNEPHFLRRLACSPVTIPTTLSLV